MIFTDDEIKLKKAICPYCGARLDIEKIDKITVCEYCDGKIFADGFEMPVKNIEEDTTPDPEYKKKFRKWLLYVAKSIAIFSVIILVMIIIDLCFKIDLLIYYSIISFSFMILFPYIATSKMPVTKGQKNYKETIHIMIHSEEWVKSNSIMMNSKDRQETKEIRRAIVIIAFIICAISVTGICII